MHYFHCDVLVLRMILAHNRLKCMLVDNGSSLNIIFKITYDRMMVDHKLTSMTSPLFRFIGDNIIPKGKITLVVVGKRADNSTSLLEVLSNSQ